LFAYNTPVPQVFQQLGNNNANAGGGFYSQGGQFYYVRGLGFGANCGYPATSWSPPRAAFPST
jgi:cobalt-zinc-cadmium resistance protein CzcA